MSELILLLTECYGYVSSVSLLAATSCVHSGALLFSALFETFTYDYDLLSLIIPRDRIFY